MLLTLGFGLEPAIRAVEGFAGTVRRFELHGVERGVSVYDDYAHHPTEVAAALAAARTVSATAGSSRSTSRTPTRGRSTCSASSPRCSSSYADHTVVLDVYGAREDPVPGVTGELVSGAFADPVARALRRRTGRRPPTTPRRSRGTGDYVITLGCGNVYQIIPQVLDALARTAAGE